MCREALPTALGVSQPCPRLRYPSRAVGGLALSEKEAEGAMVICPSGLKNAQLTSAGEPLQGSGPIEQDLIHGHLQLGHSLGLQQGAGFNFLQPSASLSWMIKKTRGSLSACGRASARNRC